MLYWFRTPPGVKVGRSALDQEAIQLIESLNPDIHFDWSRILKGEPERSAPPAEAARGRGSRRGRGRREEVHGQAAEAPGAAPSTGADEPSHEAEAPAGEPAENGSPAFEESSAAADAPSDELTAPPLTAAHARLGGEGVSRLRARYAEIRARIAERIPDESRRDELYALAERLNPDAWVTDDDVAAALDEYEAVLATIRSAVGLSRRRRRRSRRSAGPAGAASESGTPRPAMDDPAFVDDSSAAEDDADGEDSGDDRS